MGENGQKKKGSGGIMIIENNKILLQRLIQFLQINSLFEKLISNLTK